MEPDRAEQVQQRLEELYERHRPTDGAPFAISLVGVEGEDFHAGDREARFPLQSISKVFAFVQALEDHGRDKVLEHVSVEPSGEAFNSFAYDERRARPYNPMVNAGAMVTTSLVAGADDAERLAHLIEEAEECAGAVARGRRGGRAARARGDRPQPRRRLPHARARDARAGRRRRGPARALPAPVRDLRHHARSWRRWPPRWPTAASTR